jgi:threonine dehydratase
MPEMASPAKIAAVSSYGAKIVLAGSTFDESLQRAVEIAKETSATMIHPFDDPHVIAGQGTVGLELMEDMDKIDAVVAPVGGGGLISGLALAIKEKHRSVKIVGVQAAAAPSMVNSVQNGKITGISMERTIADGIAVKKPGELTYKIVSEHVDNLVTVDDNELAEAVYLLLERGKMVVEPAGAAALAAVLHHKTELEGKKVAVIVSGGNIDMPLLGQLIQRGLARSGRIVRMVIELFDRPGALKDLLNIIASKNANVLDVQQDRLGPKIGLGKVDVLLSFEIARRDQIKEITKELSNLGYEYRML